LEFRVQQEKISSESLKLLPSATFTGDHSWRDENTAAFSIDANTGTVTSTIDPVTGEVLPPAPSISRSQRTNTCDFTGAYNIIDFGVSYLRSREQENRALSTCYQWERQRQNLILDVVKAYWKAMSAYQGIARAKEIQRKSIALEDELERVLMQGNLPRIPGLQSIKQLAIIRTRFVDYERNYRDAKTQLAALMGVSPDVHFELAPIQIDFNIPDIADVETLENKAVINRPELYAADAEFRIYKLEARARLIEMFPNLSIYAGQYGDADPFLIHHTWLQSGARVAWNLFALPQRWYEKRAAEVAIVQSHESRIALTLGIMTQVHLARITFNNTVKVYRDLDHIFKINERSLQVAAKQRELGLLDGIDLINFQADDLEAEINAISAYGEMQVAIELVNNSMGLPFFYSHLPTNADSQKEIIVVKRSNDD
jgi:outer membrane protein TolC